MSLFPLLLHRHIIRTPHSICSIASSTIRFRPLLQHKASTGIESRTWTGPFSELDCALLLFRVHIFIRQNTQSWLVEQHNPVTFS
ncbi:hypothetical protein DTO207G8_7068 [Paecilomyces variotii]|nr:hypothetical protein DTO207G8_7068 [Paecilomyces variotii]